MTIYLLFISRLKLRARESLIFCNIFKAGLDSCMKVKMIIINKKQLAPLFSLLQKKTSVKFEIFLNTLLY